MTADPKAPPLGLYDELPAPGELLFRLTVVPFENTPEIARALGECKAEFEALQVALFVGDPSERLEKKVAVHGGLIRGHRIDLYKNWIVSTCSATLEPNFANTPRLGALLEFVRRRFIDCQTLGA